jgi:hypothetical protein
MLTSKLAERLGNSAELVASRHAELACDAIRRGYAARFELAFRDLPADRRGLMWQIHVVSPLR